MDPESIGAIIFLVLLGALVYFERHKIQVQKILGPFLYMVMYRTKVGLNLMDTMAKRIPFLLKYLAYAGVGIGFLGMAFITFVLIQNFIDLLTSPTAVAGVGLVLPIQAKGVFYVPFFYWIISIFILAVVHEFSHGVIARLFKIKVKSSGLACLGVLIPIIPAAFVEPDEKELQKRPHREQLAVFAAGPFSNILLGFLVLALLLFVISPMVAGIVDFNGSTIVDFSNESAVALAEVSVGERIIEIGGVSTPFIENISHALDKFSPGDTVDVVTNEGTYPVKLGEHPLNESLPYLGVVIEQSFTYKGWFARHEFVTDALLWVTGIPVRIGHQLSYPVRGYGFGLLFWLYLLNIGIGMFNLVPLGPIDGGRMIQLPLRRVFGVKKGDKVWKWVSLFVLVIILSNIIFAFL